MEGLLLKAGHFVSVNQKEYDAMKESIQLLIIGRYQEASDYYVAQGQSPLEIPNF